MFVYFHDFKFMFNIHDSDFNSTTKIHFKNFRDSYNIEVN